MSTKITFNSQTKPTSTELRFAKRPVLRYEHPKLDESSIDFENE